MSNPDKRRVHVAEIKKSFKGKFHVSTYLRRTFRQGRNSVVPRACIHPVTAQKTLAEELQLGEVDVHELYDTMDWLLERQTRLDNKLAKTHLKDGAMALFDVSSSFYTRKKSSLILHGYSRDHRSDALRELIFDDADIEAAQATRKSVVAKAKRSKSAKQKDATRRTPEDRPVQSFQDLLKDMATLTGNSIRFESSASEFNQLTESTALQRRVLDLLSTHA